MNSPLRPKAPTKSIPTQSRMKLGIILTSALLILLFLGLLLATSANAQISFPRLGLSASSEAYVDTLEVELGHEFTLYACAFGFQPGDPLDQDFSVLQWTIHQVCCGAVLQVVDVQYNQSLTHEGNPYMGVSSSSETCVSTDAIVLATLTMTLEAPEPGTYPAVAGPFAPALDCEGGNPLFMDMPVIITATGDPTPVEPNSWGAVKARYR